MRNEPARPRVLVDVNLWVSYLLPSRNPGRPIETVLSLALVGRLTLLAPENVLRELENAVRLKPYLSQRIAVEDVEELVALLRTVGEVVLRVDRPVPRVTRDAKDDYLLLLSLEHDVDIFVTGDADLLTLRDHLDRPRIMTAREFVDAFEPH